MPQMAPLWWTMIYIMNLIIMTLLIINIFFMKNYKNFNNNNNNKNIKSMNWKW